MNKETQEIRYYPDLGQSLGLVIRLIVLAIPFYFIKKILETGNQEWNSFSLLITYLFPLIIIIWYGIKRMHKFNNDNYKFKIKRVAIPHILMMILMVTSVTIIAEALTELIPVPSETSELFKKAFQPNISFFILSVCIGPVLEEALYRGIILEGLLKNYNPTKAIIWSSVLFGLAHLNPWQAISAILLGLLIGWIYWRTNSLIPGIIIHSTNNLIGFVLLNYSVELINHTLILVLLLIGALIILTLGYKTLKPNL
jgi:membrane protease YdiL (CAAX protease family)